MTPVSSPPRAVARVDELLTDPIQQLALPALLLRTPATASREFVLVYVPSRPVVAFTTKDARRPGFANACKVASDHGFAHAVRSPGGQMVAYDSGSVVVDHLTRSKDLRGVNQRAFEEHAVALAQVLRGLGASDVRVGELSGEYCPGRFSVNLGGVTKVAGSAQRVTGDGSLFSTVVQVTLSQCVRDVIEAVSESLGYVLEPGTVGGLSENVPTITSSDVARALVHDYQTRLVASEAPLPRSLVGLVLEIGTDVLDVFSVDDWARGIATGLRRNPP